MKRITLTLFLALGLGMVFGQTPTFSRYDTVVVRNILGIQLDNPWAGGINAGQFSEIDLDMDGKLDLLVFDMQYATPRTFLNRGTVGVSKYVHAPKYQKAFPAGSTWMLCRDFNCDGKADVFVNYQGGMSYYKNISTPGNLQFQLIEKKIQVFSPGFGMIQMWSSPADMPAIDDIDNDGDLDVVAWDQSGEYLHYFKNLTLEKYGVCDSIDFEVKNRCWGAIRELPTSSIPILHNYCSGNVPNPEYTLPKPHGSGYTKGGKHIGGTVLTLDVDQDTVKDLVISDVTERELFFLDNGGKKDSAEFNSIDTLFPSKFSSTLAVNFEVFPAGYYLDLNNDSVKDLIATPYALLSQGTKTYAENERSVWYYTNTGATDNPTFNYTSNEFLQNGMIEMGEGAYPAFFDYNNDTLMDLVIGNYGYYNGTYFYDSKLSLYENTGTSTKPEFRLITKDFAGLGSIPLNLDSNKHAQNLHPTFGDMDNDGDKDMIVGDQQGYLHYFQNVAPIGSNANFVLDSARFGNIDVDDYAAPFIVDLNRDGRLDLVVGERYGNINYYENVGTTSYPSFSLQTDTLGKFNTKGIWFTGFSTPYVHDNSGQYELYSGSLSGGIYYCTNIDGNLPGAFTVHTDTLEGMWEGGRSSVTGTDLNGDGLLDLAIGNYCGGIRLHEQFLITDVPETIAITELGVSVYPNPTDRHLNLVLEKGIVNAQVEVINLLGEAVLRKSISAKDQLDLSNVEAGSYILKVLDPSGTKRHISKFVISR